MIKVAGCNTHKQLISNLNCKTIDGFPVVCPPQDIQIDASTFLSISLYDDHTVCVLPNGKAVAYGNNDGNRIYNTLPSGTIERIEYEILDDKRMPCKLLSAVCGYCYTLYMAFPAYEGQGARLIYISQNLNQGHPLFLNTGQNHPIALYGGNTSCASITSEGSVIIITNSLLQSSKAEIKAISLPNNEKAILVACCDHFIFALSSEGHVYKSSSVDLFSSFEIIEELSQVKIVWISGSCRHCLAVTSDGFVYACGSNGYGEIAFNDSKEFEKFTRIESLKDQKIVSAYAGYSHSLFQTKEGLILGCGNNGYGQMLLNETTYTNNYLPLETAILKDASFCIAGHALSVVFINCNPPPNCPNQKIQSSHFEIASFRKENDDENKINHMKKKIEKLKKKNNSLKIKNDELQAEIWELKYQIAVMKKINAQQMENDEKELKKLSSQNFENRIHITEDGSFIAKKGSCSDDDDNINDDNNADDENCVYYQELEVLDSEAANELKTLKKFSKGILSKSSKVSREQYFVLKVFNNYKASVDSSSSSVAANEGSDDDDLIENQIDLDAEKNKFLINLYETLNKLNHPNIIRAVNFFNGHSKYRASILLDFCPRTLKSSVKRLNDIERIGIIYEIANAMKSVHKLGIIHRNLKPENILIDSSKHVKISDFGADILMPLDAQIKISTQKKKYPSF